MCRYLVFPQHSVNPIHKSLCVTTEELYTDNRVAFPSDERVVIGIDIAAGNVHSSPSGFVIIIRVGLNVPYHLS